MGVIFSVTLGVKLLPQGLEGKGGSEFTLSSAGDKPRDNTPGPPTVSGTLIVRCRVFTTSSGSVAFPAAPCNYAISHRPELLLLIQCMINLVVLNIQSMHGVCKSFSQLSGHYYYSSHEKATCLVSFGLRFVCTGVKQTNKKQLVPLL